jgi:FtsH-binding integral membrane protein
MNVLKQQALVADERLPLLMAMSMFLNFINLFLFLLRLMGGSRD